MKAFIKMFVLFVSLKLLHLIQLVFIDNIKSTINRNTKQLPSIALAKMNEKV